MTWPAGVPLPGSGPLTTSAPLTLLAGSVIPASASVLLPDSATVILADGTSVSGFSLRPDAGGGQGKIWALGTLLDAGLRSASIRLVSGADLTGADTRAVQSRSVLVTAGTGTANLGGSGNLVLSDFHYGGVNHDVTSFSVVRTGTGDLELLAGNNFSEGSLYGVYTAGAQSAGVTPDFELPRGQKPDGTVLGSPYQTTYEALLAGYRAYYPQGGGDLLLVSQGSLGGFVSTGANSTGFLSDRVGTWLWRQGAADPVSQATAWWVNFGTYAQFAGNGTSALLITPVLTGFTGVGALGGGNVNVVSGGDAGVGATGNARVDQVSTALAVAVGATGRVENGILEQTGGGRVRIQLGGGLNPAVASAGVGSTDNGFAGGEFTDLRGDLSITAGAIGGVQLAYGQGSSLDPRPTDPVTAGRYQFTHGAPAVVIGDGRVDLRVRGDLVLASVGDPGRAQLQDINVTPGTLPGDVAGGQVTSWFSLWTPATAVNLLSVGGNLLPFVTGGTNDSASTETISPGVVAGGTLPPLLRLIYPGTLSAVAASGNVYHGGSANLTDLELAPAPQGQLELLARGSIYGSPTNGNTPEAGGFDVSGAGTGPGNLPGPFAPAYVETASAGTVGQIAATNVNPGGEIGDVQIGGNRENVSAPFLSVTTSLFAFEPDTVTGSSHAADPVPSRVYAAGGDIVDLVTGRTVLFQVPGAPTTNPVPWYLVAKPIQVRAGRDLVDFGTGLSYRTTLPLPQGSPTSSTQAAVPSLVFNLKTSDVSVVAANRDILYANVDVAGPGTLQVSAGRNLVQTGSDVVTVPIPSALLNITSGVGVLRSIGLLGDARTLNLNGGADITDLVGVGATGPDYQDFGARYLDPANQADPTRQLSDQPGKVVQTYQDQLAAWLRQQYGYAATTVPEALAFFGALPAPERSVFLLQVYFAELNRTGLDYNDPTSRFYRTYLRGNEAIATLFPAQSPDRQPRTYQGSLTMFSQRLGPVGSGGITGDGGIRTNFGGSIRLLVPGGATTVGVEGLTPTAQAGVLTQGSGDIDIYSRGSVLLGLSRILTTFGGNILIWSNQGDINAGRGSKGTVIFTPAGISYDAYANLTLSPTVPSSGAGIGTLAPIPSVPPGDLNLVAPVGTIDAGEAGIRASGNANLSALVIVNAANISVKGTTSGVPTVAAPNISAATSANTAAGAQTSAAEEVTRRNQPAPPEPLPSLITVEVVSYGGDEGSGG